MSQKNIKQLYKEFCKKNNREYFKNYNEMVEALRLNPKSSRRTNNNIVQSYCQIKKEGQKIYLADFVKTKEFNKVLQKQENDKYSYNALIREFFLILHEQGGAVDYSVNGDYYLTKGEIREELGLIKPKFTSNRNTAYLSETINAIRDILCHNSDECSFSYVKEYLSNVKSRANKYIKDELIKIDEIKFKKICVLFDENWKKTYITDSKILKDFKNEQEKIFHKLLANSKKNISRVHDLIYFEEENQEYYQQSLECLQKLTKKKAVRFEPGYQIRVQDNITDRSLGLTIDEVKERLSKKFHQSMVVYVRNQRKRFCLISDEEEIHHIAEMQIEEEKNDIIYGSRTRKETVKRASNDNIINTALINFLLIHDNSEYKKFPNELEEYILERGLGTEKGNKELKKIIRRVRDTYKNVIEGIEAQNAMRQKKEEIEQEKLKLCEDPYTYDDIIIDDILIDDI